MATQKQKRAPQAAPFFASSLRTWGGQKTRSDPATAYCFFLPRRIRMTVAEMVTVIRDVLLGTAAVTTATVAVIGLKNWSRELRGKTEFEVARNLMRATYCLRDELQYSRSPFVSAGEFPSDYPGPGSASAEQEASAWARVYGNRWTPVREALQEHETHALEAEAIWGSGIRAKTDDLRQCARELQVATEAIVDDKAQRGENFATDKEFGKSMRATAHSSRGDESNGLNRKIASAVGAIEDVVRPHLRRR